MKSKLFAAVIIALVISQAGWAQGRDQEDFKDNPILPQGIQGQRIQSLIDTLNSGDEGRVQKFFSTEVGERFRTIVPMDEHISVFLGFQRETGGVEFFGIRTFMPERPGETVVIVKDRNLEDWQGIVVRFGKGPDFLIDGLGMSPARPPKSVEEPPLTAEEFLKQTDAFMAKLIDKGLFSGTLLVAKGEKTLLTMAAGEASKAFHVPNTIDTKFNLGSMNKMFTSTAIVQLAERGKLSLDDPISKYVDESWLPKDVTAKITIRHLLTHSSGLGSYFNETYFKSSRALFRKLDDYKPLIKDDRPAFEPGKQFQYSNTGMFLLGVVIEKVTGEDY
ncbi:MAG: pbpE 2, partial [Candidatus Aminicenantes bacterium]|nr:pbpE 2 [Candidatus Aminicenantes bacterium]